MPLVPHPVAVVDLETTGFGPADRILEIGVVLLDRELRVEGTWETLVQPGRDIDNSHVHGVTASDVVPAPRFAGVAAELAELLDGRVVIAHNAPFDTRFLAAEYARLDVGLPAADAWSLCTRTLSRRLLPGGPERLAECLDRVGVHNHRPHAALADAEATADLYRELVTRYGATQDAVLPLSWPMPVDAPREPACVRGRTESDHWLERVSAHVPVTGVAEVDGYRLLLRGALLDGHLSQTEIEQLVTAAEQRGLRRDEVIDIHLDYLRQLAVAAWADGVVTSAEREHLHGIAVQLGVDTGSVDELLAEPVYGEAEDTGLRPGDRVTFTGALTFGRDTWEQRARAAGLEVGGVTRTSALVVAANPDTMSGKGRKAREYGVPIVDETAFARMLRDLVPSAVPEAEEPPVPYASVFPWLGNLGLEPGSPDDVARAWLERHRHVPMRELSPRLDPAEVPDSLPRSGSVITGWLNRYPRPLDASITQLADVPGFGRLRVHRTLVAVVHSALDAPDVHDYLAVETEDVYVDEQKPGVEIIAEWLALLGQLPEVDRETAPPAVVHALDRLAEDPYWADPATAAFHRARGVIVQRIGDDPRDLDIFSGRILGEQTLEEIGNRHEVTRERIRQLETRLKRRLVEPDDSIHLALDALGRRYGVLAPLSDLRRDLPVLFEEETFLDTLAWLADEWEISGEWFQRTGFADELAETVADFADEFGVVSLPALADNLGVDAEILRTRLAGEATFYGDHVLTRDRSTQDRAAALLAIEGEPLSSLEIVERLGGANPRTLTNAMSVDERITRVGRDRWALREWGMEEYSNLAEWIGKRVDAGPVPLQRLLAEAVDTLGVAESSVRLYASSAEFRTVDGEVSRADEIREVDVDPEETPGLYRVEEDLVWLTTVTADHLRGSGSGVPRGVAAALGVPMLGKRELPSPLGEQTVAMSRTGATVSTIRRFLEAAGIGEGERVWLTFTGPGGFDVQHATPRREGLHGMAEVLNLTGLDTWVNPADPDSLQRITRAVGLDEDTPRRRLVSRFRYRRQDEVADLIAGL